MKSIELQKPLAVANFVIEVAKKKGNPVTNLKLQKILFFLQGYFLSNYGAPLIDGSFSKWKFGPVEQEVYKEFKDYGPAPIETKSVRFDVESLNFYSEEIEITLSLKDEIENFISKIIKKEAWELVNLTHGHYSWKDFKDEIMAQATKDYTDKEIVDCFNYSKLELGV